MDYLQQLNPEQREAATTTEGYIRVVAGAGSGKTKTLAARYLYLVDALGIAHSTEAATAQRQVNDVTNALLKKNAEALHMASVETAKEAERGIVDIETLKKTNQDLIATLDDVMKVQAEGRQKRLAAEAEMAKMEADLKNKLLEIRSGK